MRSPVLNHRPCLFPVGVVGLILIGGAAADAPPAAKLGTRVGPVEFREAAGKPLDLYDLKGKKAVVVVFLSFECPVSTSYSQPLAELSKTYADRGVAFLGVSTNPDAGPAELARHAKE